MTPTNSAQSISVLLLGGLAGAVGQAARAVVGLKKVNDRAAAENSDPSDLFVASRLFISLTIGFVAGALAILIMDVDISAISKEQILGLAAAGYAGADFVEGIISKVIPPASGNANASNLATSTPPSTPPASTSPNGNVAAMQSAWVTTTAG